MGNVNRVTTTITKPSRESTTNVECLSTTWKVYFEEDFVNHWFLDVSSCFSLFLSLCSPSLPLFSLPVLRRYAASGISPHQHRRQTCAPTLRPLPHPPPFRPNCQASIRNVTRRRIKRLSPHLHVTDELIPLSLVNRGDQLLCCKRCGETRMKTESSFRFVWLVGWLVGWSAFQDEEREWLDNDDNDDDEDTGLI